MRLTDTIVVQLKAIMRQHQGRMAEWSKALVLGTSHFGGAGSNPVPVIIKVADH